MVTNAQGKPFENTQMAEFLRGRIEELGARKSQREIAIEAGYDKPNIISMFKRGETKVPFDKLPALAKALEVDLVRMIQLFLQQPGGFSQEAVGQFYPRLTSEHENRLMLAIRKATKNKDPEFSQEQIEAIAAEVTRVTSSKQRIAS